MLFCTKISLPELEIHEPFVRWHLFLCIQRHHDIDKLNRMAGQVKAWSWSNFSADGLLYNYVNEGV
jgi:hypothetical protein